jgi:hypothetical protein
MFRTMRHSVRARKHWFRLETTDGTEMQIHFERQPRSKQKTKRWWLAAISNKPKGVLRDVIAGLPHDTHSALAGDVSRDQLCDCAADVLVLVYHLAPSPQQASQFMDGEASDRVKIRVGDAEQRLLGTLPF